MKPEQRLGQQRIGKPCCSRPNMTQWLAVLPDGLKHAWWKLVLILVSLTQLEGLQAPLLHLLGWQQQISWKQQIGHQRELFKGFISALPKFQMTNRPLGQQFCHLPRHQTSMLILRRSLLKCNLQMAQGMQCLHTIRNYMGKVKSMHQHFPPPPLYIVVICTLCSTCRCSLMYISSRVYSLQRAKLEETRGSLYSLDTRRMTSFYLFVVMWLFKLLW